MTLVSDVVAIVPAAGRSERMGRDKLLLPWGETVVVGAVIEALGRGGASDVVLVAAPDNRALRSWAESAGVRLAVNRRPERGMLSSIWQGLDELGGASALAAEGRAVLVCPGDHPALRPETVRQVVAALAEGADLALPVVDGERGHPLGIAPPIVPTIPELDPGVGLRALRERFEATCVATDDRGAVHDLDRPDDYRRARQRHA